MENTADYVAVSAPRVTYDLESLGWHASNAFKVTSGVTFGLGNPSVCRIDDVGNARLEESI